MPVAASDGIQDREVTRDSVRMTWTLGQLDIADPGRQPVSVGGASTPSPRGSSTVGRSSAVRWNHGVDPITVLLADDNLIVREGVRALLAHDTELTVVGLAADYDELVATASELQPQVLVTDIRMPPTFQDEGIEAAKEVRKRLPGIGVVVLSQYDSPEYAVDLL